jgi:hypothetical protein
LTPSRLRLSKSGPEIDIRWREDGLVPGMVVAATARTTTAHVARGDAKLVNVVCVGI